MAALHDYAFALWHNWVAVMSGGPLLLDKFLKFLWHGYDEWLARWLPPLRRRKVVYSLSFLGLMFASFLAFEDERALLIAIKNSNQNYTPDAESVVATGNDQKSAAPVGAHYTLVSPSHDKGGVILKPNGRQPITIRNVNGGELLVYPPIGAEINDGGINLPVSLPSEDTFTCISPIKCIG